MPPEVPEEEFTTLEDDLPAAIESAETSPPDVRRLTGKEVPKKPKPQEIGRFKGEFSRGLTPREAAYSAKANVAEATYQTAEALSRLKHGTMIQNSYNKFAQIAEWDVAKANELNEKYFAKWEAQNEQFTKDIDHARALKVNPNNYLQSIGRAGRASSALAVGLSQLAAGAGNVGSVTRRVESAIERDIAAQQFNIEQAWVGVRAAGNQQDRERGMLADYLTYADRARAVAYTAMAARVGAIKQSAENEMVYLSAQMIEDRFNAAALKAIADARAKLGTFYMDMSIDNMHKLMTAQGYGEQAAMMMQLNQPEAEALAPTTLRMTGGEEVGPGAGLMQAAPQLVSEERQPRTRVGSAGSRKPPGKEEPSTDIEPVGTPEPTEEEVNRRVGIPAPVVKAGGYGRHSAEGTIDVDQHPTFDDIENAIKGGNYAIASNIKDAEYAMMYDREINPPDLPEEIKELERRTDKLSPDEAARLAEARAAVRNARIRQTSPVYYMAPTIIPAKDAPTGAAPAFTNFVRNSDGSHLSLAEDSPAAGGATPEQQRKAQELRMDIKKAYSNAIRYVDQVKDVSDSVERSGVGSVLGLFAFREDGEANWFTGFDGQHLDDMGFQAGMADSIGAQVMKLVDPSGRLTDKDIEVGRNIAHGIIDGPKSVAWDNLNGIWQGLGPGDKNEYRKSVTRVMKILTIAVVDVMTTGGALGPNVEMSPAAVRKLQDRRAEAERWLLERGIDVERVEPPLTEELPRGNVPRFPIPGFLGGK